jgi:hypothetical protein
MSVPPTILGLAARFERNLEAYISMLYGLTQDEIQIVEGGPA